MISTQTIPNIWILIVNNMILPLYMVEYTQIISIWDCFFYVFWNDHAETKLHK